MKRIRVDLRKNYFSIQQWNSCTQGQVGSWVNGRIPEDAGYGSVKNIQPDPMFVPKLGLDGISFHLKPMVLSLGGIKPSFLF